MQVKIQGEYKDSPVMTIHRHPAILDSATIVIHCGLPTVMIDLNHSEALALAADLIRAVNR